MTAAYDPELCARLAQEAREDDESLRAVAPNCTCNGVASCEDWCLRDPYTLAYEAAGARCEANLRSIADQLEAAQARIAELIARAKRIDEGERRVLADYDEVVAEREVARAERFSMVIDLDQTRKRLEQCEEMRGTDRDAFRLQTRLRSAKDERDTARARILQLEEAVRSASESWMAACRERDAARAEVDQLRRVIAGVKRTIAEPCATCGAPAGECYSDGSQSTTSEEADSMLGADHPP